MQVEDRSGTVRELPCTEGKTFAQVIFLSGHWPAKALCSGLGKCGRCRIRFLSVAPSPVAGEEAVLSGFELEQGWRLACKHVASADSRVYLPIEPTTAAPIADESQQPLCVAVDLGTTSIHWTAFTDLGDVSSGALLNPQLGAGGDVMSRLAYAAREQGAREMRKVVVGAVKQLCDSLPGVVTHLSLAGNPTMTYLLLGRSVAGLSAAPYHLDDALGREEIISDGLPPAYILPQLAPFVGGDLTAGIAALTNGDVAAEYPFLLSDMGTNGEFILALSPDRCYATSVPLGPALEGIGLACGNVAGEGVVASFRLTPSGLQPLVWGGGNPSREGGMTGTAYLSLAAHLKSLGVLDDSGRFVRGAKHPLGAKIAASIDVSHGEPRLPLPGRLFLAASDVEEMLKVKAAFNMAMSHLLKAAGLRSTDLAAVYIAGAMGEHVLVRDMEALGFIPSGMGRIVHQVGNTSLAGARLVLQSPAARESAESLSQNTRVVDLTGAADFGQQFLSRMELNYIP